jgi:hypothetical protein
MVTFTLWLKIRGEETQKEAGGTPKSKVAVNRNQSSLQSISSNSSFVAPDQLFGSNSNVILTR